MRVTGRVSSASGLGLNGHACWTFAREDEFRAGAVEFLSDGLALGQRLFYLGDGSPAELADDLRALPQRDSLLAADRLRLAPLEAFFTLSERSDAERLLTAWTGATAEALNDGYTGARAVAQVTKVVQDPANWDAHVRWEAIAERFMVDHPLAALCCYDRRALPDQVLRDLAAVHAVAHARDALAPFRVYADERGRTVAGEIDYFNAGALERALERTAAAAPPDARLDLSEAEFVDHHGAAALALDRAAVTGASATLQKTWAALEL